MDIKSLNNWIRTTGGYICDDTPVMGGGVTVDIGDYDDLFVGGSNPKPQRNLFSGGIKVVGGGLVFGGYDGVDNNDDEDRDKDRDEDRDEDEDSDEDEDVEDRDEDRDGEPESVFMENTPIIEKISEDDVFGGGIVCSGGGLKFAGSVKPVKKNNLSKIIYELFDW